MGKCPKLPQAAKLCARIDAFAASAASPASTKPSIQEAAFGRLHKGGPAAFGRRPPFVDSCMEGFVEAGEAADAARRILPPVATWTHLPIG